MCVVVVQGRPRQQRGDHSLFHAGQRHLLQTGSWLCPQLPGGHLHETHLLWQLLRICKSPHKVKDEGLWWNMETSLLLRHGLQILQQYVILFCFRLLIFSDVFLHTLLHSCGVSSSKATDAKVMNALYLVQHCRIYLWPHVSECHATKMRRGTHSVLWGAGKVKLS